MKKQTKLEAALTHIRHVRDVLHDESAENWALECDHLNQALELLQEA